MKKCEKPVLRKAEEKANALYIYLLGQRDFVTKEQIGRALGVVNERSVRDVISLLATKCPIISHSGTRGYKLARTADDLDEVDRVCNELFSRMEELDKRLKPLIKFRNKVNG